MKLRLALLVAFMASGQLLAAEPKPAGPAAKPAAPAKAKADAKAKPAAKKEEPKIEGTVLTRPDGTFLGLTLAEGRFKLAFYDKNRKPVRADVLRASARWPNPHGPGNFRTVLNPAGDGTYLLAPQFVRGPYTFKLMLTLIKGEQGEQTENYTVDFRG